jgi:hypothetical protein
MFSIMTPKSLQSHVTAQNILSVFFLIFFLTKIFQTFKELVVIVQYFSMYNT